MRGAVHKLKGLLLMLYARQETISHGIVVEVERVIRKGEDQIVSSKTPTDETFIIHSPEVGFERHRTAEIEIHYAFDVPRRGEWQAEAPLRLPQLKDDIDLSKSSL